MSPCLNRARARGSRGAAFSLIELMVAIAVLSLMVVLLAQMLRSASEGWIGGKARVNSFTKARSMLDLLTRDVQGGVYRDDLAAFANVGGSGSLTNVAFYTRRSGVPSGSGVGLRNVSLVEYSLGTDGMLRRGDMPVYWTGTAGSTSFGTTNALPQLGGVTDRDTVPGTVSFRVLFLQTNGTFTPTYDPVNRPKAVAIGLAFIDDAYLKKLPAGKLQNLQDAFAQHVSGTNSLKADWDTYLSSAAMNWSDYPSDLGRGLKIFERYVLLP